MRSLKNLKPFSIIHFYYKSFILKIFPGQRLLCLYLILLILFCYVFGLILTLILLLVGFIYYIYNLCDNLLYNPYNPPDSRINVPNPKSFGLDFDNVFVYTQDGCKIHMQFIKRPMPNFCPTLVYFHGNAGNIGHRLVNALELYHQLKCNILMVEYRGFGLSEGKPSEYGLYQDALAAMKFLKNCNQIDQSQIVLFGRSLGGAVAIGLDHEIRKRPDQYLAPAAMIIENTFTSVPDISRYLFADHYSHRICMGRIFRSIPDWFYKSRFDSIQKIGSINTPTMFISGLADELIPPKMMTRLFKRSSAVYKEIHTFELGSHNFTWKCSHYYAKLGTFLDRVFNNGHSGGDDSKGSVQLCIKIDDNSMPLNHFVGDEKTALISVVADSG